MNSSNSTVAPMLIFDWQFYLESGLMILFAFTSILACILTLVLFFKSSSTTIRLNVIVSQAMLSAILNSLFVLAIAVYNIGFSWFSIDQMAVTKFQCYSFTWGVVVVSRLFFYFTGFFSIWRFFTCLYDETKYVLIQCFIILAISIMIYSFTLYNTLWTFLNFRHSTDTVNYCNVFFIFPPSIQWFDIGTFTAIQISLIFITYLMNRYIKKQYAAFNLESNKHNLEQRFKERSFLESMKILIIFLAIQTMVSIGTNCIHIFLMARQEYRFPNIAAIKCLMINNILRMVNYTVTLPMWVYYDGILRKKLIKLTFVQKFSRKSTVENIDERVDHRVDPQRANDIVMEMWATKSNKRSWWFAIDFVH